MRWRRWRRGRGLISCLIHPFDMMYLGRLDRLGWLCVGYISISIVSVERELYFPLMTF